MPERFDLLIVGFGIAGLSAAFEASKNKQKSICIIDKGDETNSNSYFAQGGIAVALAKHDSWKNHYEDTLKAGDGLCNKKVVEIITKNAPDSIKELIELGAEFDGGKNPEGGLEGGHSENRVIHINGDQTGKGITKFLKKIVLEKENITTINNSLLTEIYTKNSEYLGIKTEKEIIKSDTLIIATGGYGACFEKTTNPKTTLGSGIAIANKAGCELEGMEFIQFHPTTLSNGKNFLVSEAVRGEGGIIVNEKGEKIVDPLFTRDKVSRAIYNELALGKKVFLDTRDFENGFFAKRFPSVYEELIKNKINPEKELIPIEAAAHYTIGGIKVNEKSESKVKGIYAIGECANSGLHGANRLASNSLLEGLVMGKISAKNAINKIGKNAQIIENKFAEKEGKDSENAIKEIKKIMWEKCGIVREKKKLKEGLLNLKKIEKEIEIKENKKSIITQSALLVAEKTIESAILREKSIGTHYRIN